MTPLLQMRIVRRAVLPVALMVVGVAACATPSDRSAGASSELVRDGTVYFLTVHQGIPFNYRDQGGIEDVSDDQRLRRITPLDLWRAKYMPPSEPVVRGFYRNVGELGFWREMTCTKRFVRGGVGACAVTNWNQVEDKELGLPDVGTVTMNIGAEGQVYFAAFQPNPVVGEFGDLTQSGAYNGAPKLDHDGENDGEGKELPYTCVHCHGGTTSADTGLASTGSKAPIPDLGSVFREFEPSLLQKRPGITQREAEQEWFELNQAILAANATLRTEAEGGRAGIDRATTAIKEHVTDLYAGLDEPRLRPAAPFSRDIEDPTFMPPSWRSADADSQALWTQTVSGYCIGCHRINALDFREFSSFSYLRQQQGSKSRLYRYLADDGRKPNETPGALPYMPQAELTYLKLKVDTSAQRAIAKWTGD